MNVLYGNDSPESIKAFSWLQEHGVRVDCRDANAPHQPQFEHLPVLVYEQGQVEGFCEEAYIEVLPYL